MVVCDDVVVGILQQLVLELKMDPETLTEEEKENDEKLASKTKALLERNSKRLCEIQQYRKILDRDYHSLLIIININQHQSSSSTSAMPSNNHQLFF